MKVVVFDKTVFDVKDRDEAVMFIKNVLSAWMQEGDHLAWYWRGTERIAGRIGKPNYIVVVNSDGEHTDASASIIE